MWPPHDPDRIRSFASVLPARLGLPGTAVCEPWREGASNAVWRLDIGEVRAVLKIGKLADWRRLPVETRTLQAIGGGDAPRHLGGGSADDGFPWDWSVLERVEGEHPFALDPASAGALGRCLSRLRRVDLGGSVHRGSWTDFVKDRIRLPLDTAKDADPAILERFAGLLERLDSHGETGDLLDDAPAGIVHGDLIPPNVVRRPDGSMCVLDWENPRAGSAAWDLASIRKTFRLDDGAWDALRDASEPPPPETAIDFADALQQMQVAAWRVETWWKRRIRTGGETFLGELEQELDAASALLERLSSP